MDSIEKKDYPSFKEAKKILEINFIAKETIYLTVNGWDNLFTSCCYFIISIKKNKSI